MLGLEGSFLGLIPDLPGHLVPDRQGAAPRHHTGFPHPSVFLEARSRPHSAGESEPAPWHDAQVTRMRTEVGVAVLEVTLPFYS